MTAIIKINMFNTQQQIFVEDSNSSTGFNQYTVELKKIPEYIMKFKNLTSIHIFGHQPFIQNTANKIKEKELAQYGINKINIYINE